MERGLNGFDLFNLFNLETYIFWGAEINEFLFLGIQRVFYTFNNQNPAPSD